MTLYEKVQSSDHICLQAEKEFGAESAEHIMSYATLQHWLTEWESAGKPVKPIPRDQLANSIRQGAKDFERFRDLHSTTAKGDVL